MIRQKLRLLMPVFAGIVAATLAASCLRKTALRRILRLARAARLPAAVVAAVRAARAARAGRREPAAPPARTVVTPMLATPLRTRTPIRAARRQPARPAVTGSAPAPRGPAWHLDRRVARQERLRAEWRPVVRTQGSFDDSGPAERNDPEVRRHLRIADARRALPAPLSDAGQQGRGEPRCRRLSGVAGDCAEHSARRSDLRAVFQPDRRACRPAPVRSSVMHRRRQRPRRLRRAAASTAGLRSACACRKRWSKTSRRTPP